jgi:hypothetical protein
MKRFLRIVALALTLCNISLGVAYACSCSDSAGGCNGTGECWHDIYGMCHCTDKQAGFEEVAQ